MMRILFFLLLMGLATPVWAEGEFGAAGEAAKANEQNGSRTPLLPGVIDSDIPPVQRFIYYTLDGQPQSLVFDQPRTLVHLWATWCAPCVRELPTLNLLAKQKRPGLRIIAVAVENDTAAVGAFFRRHRIDALTPYIDRQMNAMRFLNITALPTTSLFDATGLEIDRFIGDYDWATLDPDTWEAHRMPAGPGG